MACMSLSQRIQLEQGQKKPSEIKHLNLDRSKASAIEGITDDFTNLEVLSLVNVGLEDISGLPKLHALKYLDLSGNCISGGLESLTNCPNLEKLMLSSNKIDAVETLTPLAKLSSLRSLDLTDCDVTGLENYRKVVFAALPNLKYLDGSNENNESEPESDEHNGIVSNGVNATDGDCEPGEGDDDDDDEHESDDEDEEEEEFGIEALQRSDDLDDDDEEDYAPEEEPESDDYDEDFDEEEDEEAVEDDGRNLSGAGVTGPRRPTSKRRLEDGDEEEDEAPTAKQKPETEADE